MVAAVPIATRGRFCENVPVSIATRGFFCDGAAAQDVGLKSIPDAKQVRIVNALARLLPNDPARLEVQSRVQAVADAIAPIARGDYAFLFTGDESSVVADAIAKFSLDPPTPEYNAPQARGAASADPEILNEQALISASSLPGVGDALAPVKAQEDHFILCNYFAEATGIKNLTDEEVIAVIRTIRKRRR